MIQEKTLMKKKLKITFWIDNKQYHIIEMMENYFYGIEEQLVYEQELK